MRRGYWGETGAQIHYRELAPGRKIDNPPLLCLPPAPHTGAFYDTVMAALNAERRVVAIDYPGYGGSDRGNKASIHSYAKSLKTMIDTFGPVDLLGFHTGNLVAAEIVKAQPERIGKIVMVDVPYFDANVRGKYMAGLPDEGLPTSVEVGFEKTVSNCHSSTSKERAYALWTEGLRSGSFKHDAFRAAFTYDCEAEFPELDKAVSVIATQSGLLEPSRKAAKSLPNASLTELLDITAPAFEAHANKVAKSILAALGA